MTTEDRQEFLAERKTGIGGSDCASVFNVGYGCGRRLWYDKSGVKPDYESEDSDLMELGNVLEPFFRRKYARQTGREVVETGKKFGTYRHPEHPEILVHLDGIIKDPGKEERGLLEIKSVGNRVWWDVRHKGLPVDYILQVQHGFAATFGNWGAYGIGNRDNGRLLQWDVDRDERICEEIEQKVPEFWATVGDWDKIPAKLDDPEDRRCGGCNWRLTCRGEEFIQIERVGKDKRDIPEDDSLRPLRQQFMERKAIFQEAEDLVDEVKAQLQAALGDREEVIVAGKPMYYRHQQPELVDAQSLSKAYDELLAKARLLAPGDQELATLQPSVKFKKKGKPFRALRVY